jgi:hypothetical protein
MKKLFLLLFVAGMATAAIASTENPSVEIRQTETSKVLVTVPASSQGSVTVRILDADKRLVLRDRINATEEAFAKRYDLASLPKGDYSIEVSDAQGTLRTATFSTLEKETKTVFSRVTPLGQNQFRLLVANLDAKAVTVQIFDGNQLIHTEQVDHPQGLHKVYTINKPGFPDAISFKVSTTNEFSSFVASN